MHAVVVAHCWQWLTGESIEYAHGKCFVGHYLDLLGRGPLEP